MLVALFFAQRATRGHDVAMTSANGRRARELAQVTGRADVAARLLWAEWVGVDKACDAERSRELAERLAVQAAASGRPHDRGPEPARQRRHLLARRGPAPDRWPPSTAPPSSTSEWASTSQASVLSMIWPVSPVAWPRGHPVVAFVRMLVGDHDDPMAEFERIASYDLQPFGSTVVWMFAAFGALAIDDLDTAVTAGRRGLEADPDLVFTYWGPGAHMALGAALAASGRARRRTRPGRPRHAEVPRQRDPHLRAAGARPAGPGPGSPRAARRGRGTD